MKRRKRRNTQIEKMAILCVVLILTLAITGLAYSHWTETIEISGTIEMAHIPKACIRIRKVLNGSFTDPYTGEDLTTPTKYIAVAANFSTKFQLIIIVENCGTINITDAVYDVVENTVEPINYTESKGTVAWKNKTTSEGFVQNFLNWTIGTLEPSEQATLEIWIQTLPNPSGKYEPTSENQYIEINRGATVKANSALGPLSATTEGITLTIVDDNIPENNLAVITPTLPYWTPWAEDRIDGAP